MSQTQFEYALGVTFTVSNGCSVMIVRKPYTEDDWEKVETLLHSIDKVGDFILFLVGLKKAHQEACIQLFPEYEMGAMFERGRKIGQGIKFKIN